MKDLGELFSNWGFIFKLIAFVICGVNTIFVSFVKGVYVAYPVPMDNFITLATAAYMLILAALLISYANDDTSHSMEDCFVGVGMLLETALGLTLVITYFIFSDDHGSGFGNTLVVGFLMIALGILMFMDYLREFNKHREGED